MEERIAEILADFAKRMNFDPEALRVANRKQAMVPRGATPIDPAGTAPGLVVPVDDGPTVIVLPGPPRELKSMWPKAVATGAAREVLDRAEPLELTTLRLFGIPESEIAKTLREIEDDTDLSGLEITTCLRRASSTSTSAIAPAARRRSRRSGPGSSIATAASSSPMTAPRSTSRSHLC